MSNCLHQCCTPGCGTLVPVELETEGLCVPHFLSSAEKACTEIRREAAAGESSAARRAEFGAYVAASAMRLALIGTGSSRLSGANRTVAWSSTRRFTRNFSQTPSRVNDIRFALYANTTFSVIGFSILR